MPPPQPLMTSRVRGFVCTSCLLQLRRPQRLRAPWLMRNITNDGQSRSKPVKDKKKELSFIKYFDQTPDGERREAVEDPENAAMLKDVEKQIRELEETEQRLSDEPVEDLLNHTLEKLELSDHMQSDIEELKAQMESLPPSGNLSEEERINLRNRVLKVDTEVVPFTSLSIPAQTETEVHLPATSVDVAPDSMSAPNSSSSVVVNPAMYPEEYRLRIQSLNSALRKASKRIQEGQKPVAETHKQAWRSYLLCRKVLLSDPADVPEGVWTILWKIFSDESPTNLDRLAHINYLGGDMIKAGIPLDVSQQLLYIEACFVEGDRKSALRMWEVTKDSIGSDRNALEDYWKLGIQMFCQGGQVDQALRAVSALVNASGNTADIRMLIPIIRACLTLRTDAGKQKAWALYIRLRVILGPNMSMQDYDAITSIFLSAKQPDLALGAFKDMMLTGSKSAADQDSTSLYKNATGIEDGLHLVTINKSELKWEDSSTLAKLPRQFNNKFFFGKWIKKLIGDQELDAAKKVLDLMMDRGIRPDARHMNGLIGALFRTGTIRNQTLAEDMAWKMISARIQFVEQRGLQNQLSGPLRAVKVAGREGHKTLFPVPNATIETFSILIQQYRRRQKQDRLVDLFGTLKKAQIPPNTVFMNQLIMVDTKSHQSQWAWDTYHSLVQTHGVEPDFETYEFLWHLMKKATDPVSKGSHKAFATCRTLFAEMSKRASGLNKGDKMPQDLYDEIILCFSLAEDQVGTAVALRALQRLFNMYPTENTVRTVVLQLSRLRLRNAAGSRPRRLNLNKATKNRIAQVTEVLAAFKDQRVAALLQQGINFDELKEVEKLEESLLLLSNLLRYAYCAKMEGMEVDVAEAPKIAAEQMGVPDCDPWTEISGGQENV